jgi:hypothetical protein
MQVSGILRGRKNKSDVLLFAADNTPIPVWQELACRTISSILPQNRLTFTVVSNSCLRSKGVGLCLPQSTPNLMLCCLKRARPHLVFS